jgi:uncharacterized membrane protein
MTRAYVPLAVLLVVLAFGASLALYPRAPESLPTHWNIHGVADGYSGKAWALFMMPLFMAVLVVLFRLLPWLSPRRFEVDAFRSTYLFVMFMVVVLMAWLHGLMIWSAWRGPADISRFLIGGLFLFFALVGNVLGRVRRNFWIGVRTPWTLASERVWTDTHRLAARLFVAAGALGFVLVLAGAPPAAAFVLLIAAALAPVVYSLVLYKRLARHGEV